jgi:hypothetical protein
MALKFNCIILVGLLLQKTQTNPERFPNSQFPPKNKYA